MMQEEKKSKRLPVDFVTRMQRLMGDEWEDFLQSYDSPRSYGLRRNPLKATEEEFEQVVLPLFKDMQTGEFPFERVAWAKEGYYYDPALQPGKHALHESGAYYIQEPSAMAVVEALDPQPGELILDLCAAPGGKSTQIAGRMDGRGLLVSNEIVPSRAKILSQNIERMGIRNAVVCNETPERMAAVFTAFFDRILVDAPCSGEGMFRKDDTAIEEWSLEHVQMCAQRQQDILQKAADMLKPGGVLVYSTCTFSPEENEGVISRFLETHPEYLLEEIPGSEKFGTGRGEWVDDPAESIEKTARMMPHKLRGEGHFLARMRKKGTLCESFTVAAKEDRALRKQVTGFLENELGLKEGWLERLGGRLIRFGEQIYAVPGGMPDIRGMKVVRPGLHLAVDKKNRLEPAHALALALKPEETGKKREITQAEAERYLRGESLGCTGEEKGFLLLVYAGYPVGFGKAVNGQIKNHYPKGLRKDVQR